MLNHHKNTTGYALLYLMLLFSVIFLTGLFAGLTQAMGMTVAGKLASIIILVAFWVLGFVVMQRFLAIEKRRPTLWESNILGVKSVIFVFGTLFILGTFISLISIVLNIIGGGSGGETGGPRASANTGSGNDQNLKAIQGMVGVLATMLLLYAAPFLNFAVLSRFFLPKSESA